MPLEVAPAKAERIVGEELHRLRWQQAKLGWRPKGDCRKLQIAVRRRKETILSVKQIAAWLHLGTPGSASSMLLAGMRKTTSETPTPSVLGI